MEENQPEILKCATYLVEDGFSIIPVYAGVKGAALKAWNNFKVNPSAITNQNTLRCIEKEGCNYGIRTGKEAGYVVLDADVYKKEPTKEIEELITALQEQAYMIVKTPSGGYHFYYSYDDRFDGWKKSVHGIYGYLDLQLSNAYVVGPGSTLNAITAPYELLRYEYLRPMPDNVYELLKTGKELLLKQQAGKSTEHIRTIKEDTLSPLINSALTTNYDWEVTAEEMGRFKLVPDTRRCCTVMEHEHSSSSHSCIFVYRDRVFANCFTHGKRSITGEISRKLRETFFPDLLPEDRRSIKDVLTGLLTKAAEEGLARKDGNVYRRDAAIPWLYRKEASIKNWVDACSLDEELLLNSPQKHKEILTFFLETDRSEMPFLRPDKRFIGFKNGILDLHTGKMVEEPEKIIPRHYIDQEFSMTVTNAPLFEQLVEYQLPAEIAFCLYAFIGRLFYEVKQFDNLGVLPLIKGDSETGKSTILNIVQAMFAPDTVAVLNSNQETTFGLQSKHDKELILSHEISEKGFQSLSEDVFKQIACGEIVNVSIKNQGAQTVLWKVPVFLCGNSYLAYRDVKGSISRRLAVFRFDRFVENKDSSLEKRILEKELAAIIAKVLCSYHEMINSIGAESWQKVCPEYFADSIAEMRQETDLLHVFLTQDDGENAWARGSIRFQYVKGQSMLLSDFRKKFQNWCRYNQNTTYKWTSDYSSFRRLGYDVVRRQTCCSCLRPIPENGVKCCANYNRDNRTQKYVIMNIICHEKRMEHGHYVSQ